MVEQAPQHPVVVLHGLLSGHEPVLVFTKSNMAGHVHGVS